MSAKQRPNARGRRLLPDMNLYASSPKAAPATAFHRWKCQQYAIRQQQQQQQQQQRGCSRQASFPSFLGHGFTFHGLHYFIALSVAPGKTLWKLPHIDNAVRSAALASLDALDEGGVIHGDVHGGNILVDLQPGQAPKVTFVDLGHSWLSEQLEHQGRAERQARDRHALLELMPSTEDFAPMQQATDFHHANACNRL
eukprot:jgi/Chrzof1/10068/Cz04g25290.t1